MTAYDKEVFSTSDDVEQDLTKEQIKKVELEIVKEISKKECSDNNIDVSLIAFNELLNMGFKRDVEVFIFSKLIEDIYHERRIFDSSDYFDLSSYNNEHFTELAQYFNIGKKDCYRVMIMESIVNSDSECKNINEIVYGTVSKIQKIINNKTMKYGA